MNVTYSKAIYLQVSLTEHLIYFVGDQAHRITVYLSRCSTSSPTLLTVPLSGLNWRWCVYYMHTNMLFSQATKPWWMDYCCSPCRYTSPVIMMKAWWITGCALTLFSIDDPACLLGDSDASYMISRFVEEHIILLRPYSYCFSKTDITSKTVQG